MATHSPVHPASLVDASLHSPALLELLDVDLSRTLTEYIVDTVVDTVDYAMGRPSSSSRGRSLARHPEQARFTNFVSDVIRKAEIKVPALLVTLVYINRAKPHIQIALEQWACERVFLGALILANKYLNDSTLKNVHWALCTGVFGKRDIGRIEREFLDVLDFDLAITEEDILSHHSVIMSLIHPSRPHFRTSPPSARNHNRSRWSSASSDLDGSDSSSFESLSPPHTPEPHHVPDTAAAFIPPPPQLHLTEEAHFVAPAPSAESKAHSHQQSRHARPSIAMQILRSFPMPHLPSIAPHHHHSSGYAASSISLPPPGHCHKSAHQSYLTPSAQRVMA